MPVTPTYPGVYIEEVPEDTLVTITATLAGVSRQHGLTTVNQEELPL